jgi:two-component system LytT family response regulator
MDVLRYLIVEDEVPAANHIKNLIGHTLPSMQCLGIASSIAEAHVAIEKTMPDILFLDIRLGDMSGFDLLKLLDQPSFALIVVTGYDHYGIEAVKSDAVDYLLKPVDVSALCEAMARVNKRKKEKGDTRITPSLIIALEQQVAALQYNLSLPVPGGQLLVKPAEIIRLQADGSYTYFFLEDGNKLLVTQGMFHFEKKLAGYGFIRCHNQHLVNRRFISGLKYQTLGGLDICLKNKEFIPVSRAHHKGVKMMLADL